jgi:hypothetical protein
MTAPGQSPADAKSKMCAYVKNNLEVFKTLANSPQMRDQIQGYRALGRALHPIIDSTLPAHAGWQTWYNPLEPWHWDELPPAVR